MTCLTKAHAELFSRSEDECFESLPSLHQHCLARKERSLDLWRPPDELKTWPEGDRLMFQVGEDTKLKLNDWSFSQLCRLAGVSKETVNRLTPDTAFKVFGECLPRSGNKPLQLFAEGEQLRSLHQASYTRVHDADVVALVREYASDFTPPQKAGDDLHTGLYCGEQDLFAFLIDPTGWTEINGEAFAPGFFVWNSEVGRRSLGIQTFWFQKVCQNHIVWDVTEVVEFSRKHTAGVHEGLNEIRRMIEELARCRNDSRGAFARIMNIAMSERLGDDKEQVIKKLSAEKIPRHLITEALEIARRRGAFTIFALVDALTQLSQSLRYAGDRVELDAKIGRLMSLAL